MDHINFLTPVTFGPFVKSWGQSLLEKADDYFSLSSEKYVVIPGFQQANREGVRKSLEQPQMNTAFKVASYIAASVSVFFLYDRKSSQKLVPSFFIAIPVIAAVAKVVLRTFYRFHMIDTMQPPFVGEISSVPETELAKLEYGVLTFNKKYRFSSEDTAKLRIVPDCFSINHDLPQESNETYVVPPRIITGHSELKDYQNSIFEFEYKASVVDKNGTMLNSNYEIVRRKEPFMKMENSVGLTADQLEGLKIIRVSNNSGYSIRKEYQDFSFDLPEHEWQLLSENQVKMIPKTRNYKFLPFNQAVTMTSTEFIEQKYEYSNKEFRSDWKVYHSSLGEYSNSVILMKQVVEDFVCVRMLKPKERE